MRTSSLVSRSTLVTAAASLLMAGAVSGLTGAPADAAARVAHLPTHTVGVGKDPYGIAVDRRVGEAFVVNAHSVSVVDLHTHRVVDNIQSAANPDPQNSIAVNSAGSRVYVGSYASPYMSVINALNHKVLKTSVVVGNGTTQIVPATTAAGPRLYLVQTEFNRIAVIDASALTVLRYIPFSPGPTTLAVTPNHRQLWVGGEAGQKIWVLNASTGKVVRKIPVRRSGPLNDIVLAPNGRTALVAGPVGVSLLRVPSGRLVHSWTTPKLFPGTDNVAVYSMTLNRRGTRAYVLNSTFVGPTAAHGAVRVLNTRTGVLGARIRTGLTPQAVAVDTASNTGYVANWGSRSLTLFPLHP